MTHSIDRTTARIKADLRTLVHDTEALVEAADENADEHLASVRTRVAHVLDQAKLRLGDASDAFTVGGRRAGHLTDHYVHAHPWPALATSAAIGFLLGVLVGRR